MESAIDIVAWYGAILASAVALFDLVKWFRSRARLRVVVAPKTIYEDGGFSGVEKTAFGEARSCISYYHIEVINMGELPTTIVGIKATTRALGRWRRSAKINGDETSYSAQAFIPHFGERLPHVLGPGQMWSCRVPERLIDSLRSAGLPKLEIRATCRRAPLYTPFALGG